ncbi:AMP-binding protein, partial [bacterium]|nr:AMP-binding protein [bacterium]
MNQHNESIPERIAKNLKYDDVNQYLTLLSADGSSRNYSYSDLISDSNRWQNLYHNHVLRPTESIVVILPHSFDLYSSYLGALLGGFIPAMFTIPSPKFSEKEYLKTLGSLLENAAPKLVVTTPQIREKIKDVLLTLTLDIVLLTPEDKESVNSGSEDFYHPDPGDIAFLQYSSGTTGLKKGVAISHEALLWQIDNYAKSIEADENDRIISWLPLYHDMGLIACFFLPIIARVPIVAMSPFDWVTRPAMLLQAISTYRGTLCWLPNFAYNFLAKRVNDEELAGVDLASLRGVVNCSEPVLASSHKLFVDRFAQYGLQTNTLAASYAMAENTYAVTSGGFSNPLRYEFVDNKVFIKSNRIVEVVPVHPDAKLFCSSGTVLPETEL